MATVDKAKNDANQAKGRVKKVAGRIVGDDGLRAERGADQMSANLKEAGYKVKDASRE